jgi:RNA polymerase sigma-70 factor (ECF subfamily)
MNTTMNIAGRMHELVHEAKSGSREAFTQLVRLHHESVRAYLGRNTPHRDVADDLAQETFLVAFRRIGEFRGEARFSTWLIGIARNLALEYLRRECRRQRRDLEAAVARDQAERLSAREGDADEHEQTLAALRACLDGLPAESRVMIDQFYFDNVSAESLAERVGKRPGAVRMSLLRIRRALADCVQSKLHQQESTP